MPFLTDLRPHDVVELKTECSTIKLKFIKRTGAKVRISIDAGEEVVISKIDSRKEEVTAKK